VPNKTSYPLELSLAMIRRFIYQPIWEPVSKCQEVMGVAPCLKYYCLTGSKIDIYQPRNYPF